MKSKKMEDAFKRVEEAMLRTDSLLSQMMPKSVTERLRTDTGETDICDVCFHIDWVLQLDLFHYLFTLSVCVSS